jgi:hypothetical protein
MNLDTAYAEFRKALDEAKREVSNALTVLRHTPQFDTHSKELNGPVLTGGECRTNFKTKTSQEDSNNGTTRS